ncbi:MAG TPA: hypothetical protein VGV59_11300 [Pyrinomonadaceae bacterium]|nr:hypothetical protein [Pyrinomonadaceae bacterium]
MNTFASRHRFPALFVVALLLSSLTVAHAAAAAPQREHLTPEEIEKVRDNQELDKRIGIFIRAAERRFLAVTDPQQAAARAPKEAVEWGELKGTRTQLLGDLSRILDEAITNIDDTAARIPSSPLLKKSLKKLAEAATRFAAPLDALRTTSQDEAEREALEQAIERIEEIVEAAGKHPLDEKEDESKGDKKKKNGR